MSLVGLVVLLLLLPFVGGIPICRAFEAGLEAARDPANRTTPESPWHFFGRAAWRSLRRWLLLWGAVLLVPFTSAFQTDGNLIKAIIFGAFMNAFIAAILLFHTSLCWRFSPRVRSTGMLVLGGIIISTFVAEAIWIVSKLLPPPIGTLVFTRTLTGGGSATWYFPLGHYWALLVALIVYTFVRRRAKRMGNAWFRFEE